LSYEFEGILNYVGEVKAVQGGAKELVATDFHVKNVLREDGEGHEPGLYTEKLLAAAPGREGQYIKVKKIL
jgi:Asp-tRNA(Asn)/Glu-tRNA(Gln) amidotransferase C subunit